MKKRHEEKNGKPIKVSPWVAQRQVSVRLQECLSVFSYYMVWQLAYIIYLESTSSQGPSLCLGVSLITRGSWTSCVTLSHYTAEAPGPLQTKKTHARSSVSGELRKNRPRSSRGRTLEQVDWAPLSRWVIRWATLSLAITGLSLRRCWDAGHMKSRESDGFVFACQGVMKRCLCKMCLLWLN